MQYEYAVTMRRFDSLEHDDNFADVLVPGGAGWELAGFTAVPGVYPTFGIQALWTWRRPVEGRIDGA